MSFMTSLVSSGVVGMGGYYFKNQMEKSYPASGMMHKPGEKIVGEDGTEGRVVGYFGADEQTFEEIDFDRGLFYTNKKTAQGYADRRAAEPGKGKVGCIVADRLPGAYDFQAQTFEGPHAPLSPDFLRKANVRIIGEQVTDETRLGFTAAYQRSRQVNGFMKDFIELTSNYL